MPRLPLSRVGLRSPTRARAALPVLAAFVVLAACNPHPMDGVGMSPVRPAGSSAPRDAAAPSSPPSPVPADFREHMAKLSQRQLSAGHAQRFDGVVWGSESAKAAWDARAPMPEGAVLVEEAIEGARTGDRPMGLLFMEKKGGAWRFLAIGPEGATASDARCQACHAEAPRDGVFRVDQASSAASTAPTTATVPTAVATPAATVDARSAGRADASVSP